MYDPLIGRFLSADTIVPGAGNPQAWNRYTFVFNNPLGYVDASGHIPYPITIRSFAPFDYFGFGYEGDNRGYSSDPSVTARVHQKIDFDTDKTSVSESTWSSPSRHCGITCSDPKTGIPRSNVIEPLSITTNAAGKQFAFKTWYGGANPLAPSPEGTTPEIDVFSEFTIVENKKADTLSINGKLTGDNFPSTEAYITDPSGQSVFLGIGFYGGLDKNSGPFFMLPGQNKNQIASINLIIALNKSGNFSRVIYKGRSYRIDLWNAQFTQADPHDRNSSSIGRQ
jgi:hypothetical protein